MICKSFIFSQKASITTGWTNSFMIKGGAEKQNASPPVKFVLSEISLTIH